MAAVTARSLTFAPENTPAKSARMAAGPVTEESISAGRSVRALLRRSLTAPSVSEAVPSATSSGTNAAVPSSLGMKGPPRSLALAASAARLLPISPVNRTSADAVEPPC